MLRKGIAVLMCLVLLVLGSLQIVSAAVPMRQTSPLTLPTADTAVSESVGASEFIPSDGCELYEPDQSYNYGTASLYVKRGSSFSVNVTVPKSGRYHIVLDYLIPEQITHSFLFSLSINGVEVNAKATLQSVWKDKGERYAVDSFGNDLFPNSERVFIWQKQTINDLKTNRADVYNMQQGDNLLKFTVKQGEAMIGRLTVQEQTANYSFDEYIATLPSGAANGQQEIVLEAERFDLKSKASIRGQKGRNPSLYPYDSKRTTISALDASSWDMPGDFVVYEFDITDPGIYYIAIKYTHNDSDKKMFPVYKNIYVDDRFVYDGMADYAFTFTGDKYVNHYLSHGEERVPYYFSAGKHSIKLESCASVLSDIYNNLFKIVLEMNDLSLDVKMIRGSQFDANRDWQIEDFIPDIREKLKTIADRIEAEYNALCALTGNSDVAAASNLKIAVRDIRDILTKRRGMDNFVTRIESFAALADGISNFLVGLLKQPLTIDRIYIHSGDTELPKANAGFFRKIIEQIKQLFYSFFSEVDEPVTVQKDKLNVWAIRAGPQIEAMRECVARSFTPEAGIDVHISSVVDEQKVLLAVSSGTLPDLICGGVLSRAYDLALRGVLKNLRDYPDFNEIAKRYNPEMFVPFIHDDGCYAMPEAANFWVMYYRTDILNKLHLSIPKTWGDVIDMLPILYDNDMTFDTLLANTGSLKPLVSMMPYLHQHGASLYSQNGDRVNFLEPEFSQAFVSMTEMYTKYSVAHTIGSFFVSFRDGKSPIGIGDLSTYLQLKNAAPELEGNWAIGPSIGVWQGDTLVYDQPAVASGCYIMKSSSRTDDAWDFIKGSMLKFRTG